MATAGSKRRDTGSARSTAHAALSFALVLAATGVALATAACESRPAAPDAGPNEPSPNASILPAPLATAPERAGALHPEATPDAAPPQDAGVDAEAPAPETLREDQPLAPDTAELRELAGLALRARFRWPDLTPAPRPPESSAEALDRARAASTFDVGVELGGGRLCLRIASGRFLLPEQTELRARSEHLGYALVWPDRTRYVVLQPGALRAVFNEHRADTLPLASVTAQALGNGRSLGFPSEKSALVTPLGRLELEQVRVTGSTDNGALLCRVLVELVGARPDNGVCKSELVPARAEYSWSAGGRLTFEVSSLERVAALDPDALRVPPPTAEHRIGELPTLPSPLLLSPAQTRALRTRPAPRVEAKDGVKQGLSLVNVDDLTKYVLVDGVPVVRLSAGGAGVVLDLLPGAYALSARSFLGDDVTPQVVATVPSRFVIGTPATEAPLGGAQR